MRSVPPPSQLAAPPREAGRRPSALEQRAWVALTTAAIASTVSFTIHAFGIPHEMHRGKSVGPGLLYLALTVLGTLVRRRRLTGLSGWALAVLVGGGVANLLEALLFGGVTDFLPLHIGAFTLIFSAGDVAVLVATAASVLSFLWR
jgi:lipoprotein signal peptidase